MNSLFHIMHPHTPRTNTQTLDPINLKQFILGDIELCNKDIGI